MAWSREFSSLASGLYSLALDTLYCFGKRLE